MTTVAHAHHGTVNGTDLVEFTARRYKFVITNLDASDVLYAAFDDGNGASAGADDTVVILPGEARTFDHESAFTVSLYSAASIEYHVEAYRS